MRRAPPLRGAAGEHARHALGSLMRLAVRSGLGRKGSKGQSPIGPAHSPLDGTRRTFCPLGAGNQQAPAFCSQKFSNCCASEPAGGAWSFVAVSSVVDGVVGAAVPPLVPSVVLGAVVVGAAVPPVEPVVVP